MYCREYATAPSQVLFRQILCSSHIMAHMMSQSSKQLSKKSWELRPSCGGPGDASSHAGTLDNIQDLVPPLTLCVVDMRLFFGWPPYLHSGQYPCRHKYTHRTEIQVLPFLLQSCVFSLLVSSGSYEPKKPAQLPDVLRS